MDFDKHMIETVAQGRSKPKFPLKKSTKEV